MWYIPRGHVITHIHTRSAVVDDALDVVLGLLALAYWFRSCEADQLAVAVCFSVLWSRPWLRRNVSLFKRPRVLVRREPPTTASGKIESRRDHVASHGDDEHGVPVLIDNDQVTPLDPDHDLT